MLTVLATVVLGAVWLGLWHEAWLAHRRDRHGDDSGVFIAAGSLFAYGAMLTSGIGGL